jgi:hypothetical protein
MKAEQVSTPQEGRREVCEEQKQPKGRELLVGEAQQHSLPTIEESSR